MAATDTPAVPATASQMDEAQKTDREIKELRELLLEAKIAIVDCHECRSHQHFKTLAKIGAFLGETA